MRGLASRLRLPIEVPGTSSRHFVQPCDTPGAIDYDHLPDILRAGRDLVADLSIAPDLATPRSSFATDDLAEYPHLGDLAETCGYQEA
ncbi:hypothetical protein L6V77_29595 [Myxococcota bacterium]|nr:hypothetical protein [Myxococcota bacterium]